MTYTYGVLSYRVFSLVLEVNQEHWTVSNVLGEKYMRHIDKNKKRKDIAKNPKTWKEATTC